MYTFKPQDCLVQPVTPIRPSVTLIPLLLFLTAVGCIVPFALIRGPFLCRVVYEAVHVLVNVVVLAVILPGHHSL